jgi:hypothetical protein
MLWTKDARKARPAVIGAIFSGILVFLSSWFFYCKIEGADFARPFVYTFTVSGTAGEHMTPSALAQNILYCALWLGAFPLLTIIFAVFTGRRSQPEDPQTCRRLIFFCGISMTLFYSIFGGASFGYIRYITPAIPLIYIGSGLVLAGANLGNWSMKKALILFFVSTVVLIFVLGDLLYVFRYAVREYALFRFVATGIIYAAIFFVYLRFSPGKIIAGLLIALSASSIVSATVIQSTAHYNTGFNYGETGMAEAARYISGTIPEGSTVIGPKELIYHMRLPASLYQRDYFWLDMDKIKTVLARQETSAFVYSIVTNTVAQIRAINKNDAIQKLLRRNFKYSKIGSYNIWIRSKR